MKRVMLLALVVAACSDSGTGPPEAVTGLRAVEIVAGLESPVHLTAPAGDARLFIIDQPGVIRIVSGGALLPTPFLDLRSRVSYGGERGLFSIAFDPAYATSGHFWVNYTDTDGDTRIERYRVSADPNVADPASALLVLEVGQPYANHNGGQIAFGPDGMLYIGMGDGGSGGDPDDHGQTLSTLLGAMLRIDVRTAPYVIPPDNPYAGSISVRPEIWGYGLRNPWRFSFDAPGGMLYIADVGQNQWEEINAVPADEAPVNYGWNVMEGAHCFGATSCDQTGLTMPVHEYSHAEGCSITGGHAYRGASLSGLQGHYFYSDFCTGFLRSFRLAGGSATDHEEWDVGGMGQVLSFGEDAAGELYVLSRNGRVYQLQPDS
ncbi:MAG TPA: PQQ-dependent sugar dehydrogenase [Longimicrobiales bacterium]|nr:PQQ-dependent sugar dehydrogenase [Longimicrobiales bacterium]